MIADLAFALACIISAFLAGFWTLGGWDKVRAWWRRRRQERRMRVISKRLAQAYKSAERISEATTPDRPLVEKLSEEAERPQLPAWFEASQREFEEAREKMQ